MNIKELERRTGITKQNIRFYERKGLLNPVRNEGNNYREYVEEDVKTLEVVKILRKLDMSIEDIHRILQKEVELDVAVKVGSLYPCLPETGRYQPGRVGYGESAERDGRGGKKGRFIYGDCE